MKRVALGGLHTECSSYSPLQQTAADFTRLTEHDLVDLVPFDFAANNMDVVPLSYDRSVPGGPVSAQTFAKQRVTFMAMLKDALPVDGVLLLMHGAMFVPGIDDPEGTFIAEVREIVGPDAIIAAAFDLHGQVTARIIAQIDAFAAYRTAPHIDTPQTYGRAAQMLSDALSGGPRPSVSWQAIPILVPGEMSSTFVAPCDRLYAALPGFDAREGVLDSNLMIGYVWADSPRATAAAVVTATDKTAGDHAARMIAQTYLDARDELAFDMTALDLAEAIGRSDGIQTILADSGDNPTAGGVGDRADVIFAVLDAGLPDVLVAGIADPVAYALLAGGKTRITLGGSLGGGGPLRDVIVDHVRIVGDIAVATIAGLTVLITQYRRPFHHFSDFDDLGLAHSAFQTLVVKSGYLSPDLRTLPWQQIMVLTDGAVCQKLDRLTNLRRPKGTWPFDAM